VSNLKSGGTVAGGAAPVPFSPPTLALATPIAQPSVANQTVRTAFFDFINGTISLLVQNQDANGNPIGQDYSVTDPNLVTLAQVANLIAADLGAATGQQGTPSNAAVPAAQQAAGLASSAVKAP
jgi:hypothetical protein